jgi:hypothetical protein
MSVTVPPGNFVCECCGFWYPVPQPIANDVEARLHRSQLNREPTRCTRCSHHQDDDAETVVRRAYEHELVYWEQYTRGGGHAHDACRGTRQ